MNILLDGMGGDYAPQEIVKGAILAAGEIKDTITIIGNENDIKECLRKNNWKGNNIEVVNATEEITNNEHPAMAVRKKKDSSVVKGMNMIKAGEADAFISAGSTGALLTAALFVLGRIKGIKRPAIAAFFPKIGMNDTSVVVDCGANVDAKPEFILQNGIMGSIFVNSIKGVEAPSVGLLNIGAEEAKGDELHKAAYELLKSSDLNFIGNVEGRDVCFGVCDVVATDGFSGNIFLKSSEGAALAIMKRIKEKLTEGVMAKMGAVMAYGKLKDLKEEFNYEKEGGAPILGVKGAALKIHGNSKADAVYYAIMKAILYVENDVTGRIETAIADSKLFDKDESEEEK